MKTKLMTVLAIAGIAMATACNSNRNERMDDIDTTYIDTMDIDNNRVDTIDNINRGDNSMGGPDTVGVTPLP